MIPGIDGLGDELRVLREPMVATLFREAGRFVAQDDDNLVFYVKPA